MASSDGLNDLVAPFESLGRRIVHGWSRAHVEAALPGRRSRSLPRIRHDAWKTLFELSRYARDGMLPVFRYDEPNASGRISPALIWLLYPLYPAPRLSHRGRGLAELVDGSMIEAVADTTGFNRVIRADHAPLPSIGRPFEHPEFYHLAKAFWQANPGKIRTGVVLRHIQMTSPAIFETVPVSSRYRVAIQAMEEVRRIG